MNEHPTTQQLLAVAASRLQLAASRLPSHVERRSLLAAGAVIDTTRRALEASSDGNDAPRATAAALADLVLAGLGDPSRDAQNPDDSRAVARTTARQAVMTARSVLAAPPAALDAALAGAVAR